MPNLATDPQRLDMPLDTVWAQVQEVRSKLDEMLAEVPSDLRDAAVMTASELVENAIKYGVPVEGTPRATLSVDVGPTTVTIVVRNGARLEESVQRLKEHVARLQAAEDRAALYRDAFLQSMAAREGSARLGIFRIGCEGGFDLSCDFADATVTMTATRRRMG